MKRAFASVLVSVQFILLAALVFVPRGSLWPVTGLAIAVGLVLILVGTSLAIFGVTGLGTALTASPVPRQNAALVTTGAYAMVRHPIYTGLMMGGLGLAVLGSSLWHAATWVALVILLATKTRWEERMLLAEHSEYRHYAARIGRFMPGIGRVGRR
jgi:protein-S-isoprenylcysteine O-methyltransferase Ste14